MAFSDKLGEAIIHIRASSTKLRADMQKSVGVVRGAAVKMKTALASISSAFGPLAIAAGVLSIGKAAVTATSKLETMRVSFASMLGSAKEADKLVGTLSDFSASTPFQLDDIAAASKQLLTAGTAVEGLTEQLRVVGDIAAGANVPLNQMAQIFAKIQNKGRAYTEELLQLSDRGIPIIRVLSEQLGVTKDEVFELASQGKLTSEVMNRAFESMTSEGGIFYQQMIKQSQTLAGRWSTLKDRATLLAGDIGSVLAPAISGLVEGVIAAIETIKPLVELIKSMATVIGDLSVKVKEFFDSFDSRAGKTAEQIERLEEGSVKFGKGIDKSTTSLKSWQEQLTGSSTKQQELNTKVNTTTESVKQQSNAMQNLEEDSAGLKDGVKKDMEESTRATQEFGQGLESIGGIFGNLVNSFKSGDIGGIINSIFSVVGGLGGGSGGGGGGIGSILGSLGGLLGGGGGGGGFGGFFAEGGTPPVGKVSMVGEQGPELFVPSSSGTIIPNHELNKVGSGGNSEGINLSQTFIGVDEQIMKKIKEETPAIIEAATQQTVNSINRKQTNLR